MMTGNLENKKRMEGWDVTSPESEGLHKCIQPGIQDCKAVSIYRVNLNAGSVFDKVFSAFVDKALSYERNFDFRLW